MYTKTSGLGIHRILDGAYIPADLDNSDYREYLKWVAAGNIPEPYVPPTPPELSPEEQIKQIERETMVPRVVREFMLGVLEAQATPEQLLAHEAYQKVKAIDNQIKELRKKL